MSDALLSDADREEALSRAYVCAVAAGAGYVTYRPEPDRDSIDIGFAAKGRMRPNLHAQLKATINLRRYEGGFRFGLRRKNYDDLRAETMVPRIVVVLDLPRNSASWLNVSVRRLMLKRCAFWTSLQGMPELPSQQQSVTIDIPEVNVFDVDGIQSLMMQARTGAVT